MTIEILNNCIMRHQILTTTIAFTLLAMIPKAVFGQQCADKDRLPKAIAEKYDSAYSFFYNYPEENYIVFREGKAGVANANAVELLPPIYDGVYTLDHSAPNILYFMIVKEGKCAMFNHEYQPITPFIYQYLHDINRAFDEKATDSRQTLFYAVEDGKVGVIDSTGTTVLPFDYDKIGPYNQNCFVFSKDGKIGAVNDKNEVIQPFEFDMIVPPNRFIDSLYAVSINGKWAVAHKDGALLTDYIFDFEENGIMAMKLKYGDDIFSLWSDFWEGLAVVVIDGKYGFMDKTGKMVLSAQYECASPFSEGLAAVQGEKGWYYINRKGNTIIAGPYYCRPGDFINGQARIETEDGYYMIDKKGHTVSVAVLAQSNDSQGVDSNQVSRFMKAHEYVRQVGHYYKVTDNGLVGLYDATLHELLPVKYMDVDGVLDNLFTVQEADGWWLVTIGGRVLSRQAYKEILLGLFNEGNQYFIAASDGDNWGLLDADGNPVTPMVIQNLFIPQLFFGNQGYPCFALEGESYSMISSFNEGLAVVKKQTWVENEDYEEGQPPVLQKFYCGYMDTNCNIVIECEYDTAKPFNDGRAEVTKEGKTFLIDKQGKIIE